MATAFKRIFMWCLALTFWIAIPEVVSPRLWGCVIGAAVYLTLLAVSLYLDRIIDLQKEILKKLNEK